MKDNKSRYVKYRKRIHKCLAEIFLIVVLFFVFFPILYMICGSFMKNSEIDRHLVKEGIAGIHLIPEYFVFDQYKNVLIYSPELLYYFWNSVILTMPILLGVFIIAPLAGNGFAKYKFPGKKIILAVYILLAILPYQAMLVPNYIVLDKLKLLGSRQAIWYPYIWNPFGVYLMYRFFAGIDEAGVEAARLDGAGEWRIYFHITLPQVLPGLATLFLITMADAWSMVEQPLIFLKDARQYPLSVAFSSFVSDNIGIAFAGAIVYLIPIFFVFLLTKEYLTEGIEVTVRVG